MISIKHLRKEYDQLVALENLSLEVPRGECFGLIGPNGAGKTTLLRILATLLEPTYGSVHIKGIDILERPLEVHKYLGYLSDVFAVYEDMLVWEYLDHFARCYGITSMERRDKLVDEVLELVSLRERKDAEIKGLSRGMRQRLCLAKTLIHQPEVLLLDEPASGMDPAGRIEFREMLKQLIALGRTILISSHILTEMADFCTSVAIIERGELLASGKVTDILQQLQPALRLELEVLGPPDTLLNILKTHPTVQQVDLVQGRIIGRWHGAREELPALHQHLVHQGIPLISLAVKNDNLEDIYMKISGHRTS
ncbi:MAG: ABC transporter ATP-binding protein [Planctomycetia bacterium]|nr:ABC transporter ATP-binding protein [Planctomycetia bacterium]